MSLVKIDAAQISDWATFHSVFASALGFPEFYGKNMDAWIDCMTCLDDSDAGMSLVTVKPGELLHLEITGVEKLRKRLPAIHDTLIDCAAFVNLRRIEKGEPPVLALVLS